MKITQKDYQGLKQAIEKAIQDQDLNINQLWVDYSNLGFSEMRFRWDLFHLSRVRIGDKNCPGDFNLYDYLNDNHIDTALKNIVKELFNKTWPA